MTDLMRLSVHKSLHKPNLVMGCEFEPFLMAALIPVALSFSSFNLIMVAVGGAFFLISAFFLRIMAKKDPLLTKIWLRFIKYQDFYPARTSVWHVPAGKVK